MRWAVLSAFFMFMACGTFEIGFTYIAALFGFAWLYTGSGKMRPALRLCLAPLAGEIISFGFNMGSRAGQRASPCAASYRRNGVNIGGISPNFDLPAGAAHLGDADVGGVPPQRHDLWQNQTQQCAALGCYLRHCAGNLRGGWHWLCWTVCPPARKTCSCF